MGSSPFGVDAAACQKLATAIRELVNAGHQMAVVIGGGNIFRGLSLQALGMARTPADQMGMLATVLNGLALQQALLGQGSNAHLMSAIECPQVAERYQWAQAVRYLERAEPVIFVGGTGNPYFTTDTAAALRASEIGADLLLKATKVDGVYSADPKKERGAQRYPELSYTRYLSEKLAVMDATAVALCMQTSVPIFVFSMELLGHASFSQLLSEKGAHGTFIR